MTNVHNGCQGKQAATCARSLGIVNSFP